jgi:hypothetical protein
LFDTADGRRREVLFESPWGDHPKTLIALDESRAINIIEMATNLGGVKDSRRAENFNKCLIKVNTLIKKKSSNTSYLDDPLGNKNSPEIKDLF